MAQSKVYKDSYAKKNIEAGKCSCSRPLEEGYKTCAECRLRKRNWTKNKVDNGFCCMCPDGRYKDRIHCYTHVMEQIAINNLGDRKYAEYLAELLLKQNEQCDYCKTHIELCGNAEADHLSPTDRFPELQYNLDNVHWVCGRCNRAKNNMTHDEFLSWMKLVLSHY